MKFAPTVLLTRARALTALALSFFMVAPAAHATVPPSPAQVQAAAGKLSLPWVPNQGQWSASAAFRAQSFAGSVWVTHDGKLIHQFNGPKVEVLADAATEHDKARRVGDQRKGGWVLSERFVGGTIKQIKGLDLQVATSSYFLPNAPANAANLPSYGQLALGEVYPGVSVALKATQANVEKVYTVAPIGTLASFA